MPNPPSTRKPTSNDTERPPRLIITMVAVCVAVFIAAEPLLFNGATSSMRWFQGTLVFLLWLLLMFGSASAPGRK